MIRVLSSRIARTSSFIARKPSSRTGRIFSLLNRATVRSNARSKRRTTDVGARAMRRNVDERRTVTLRRRDQMTLEETALSISMGGGFTIVGVVLGWWLTTRETRRERRDRENAFKRLIVAEVAGSLSTYRIMSWVVEMMTITGSRPDRRASRCLRKDHAMAGSRHPLASIASRMARRKRTPTTERTIERTRERHDKGGRGHGFGIAQTSRRDSRNQRPRDAEEGVPRPDHRTCATSREIESR